AANAPDDEPRSWVETLKAAYGETRAGAASAFASAGESPDRSQLPEQALPFEALLVPLVRLARQRVAGRTGAAYAGVEPAAHAALEHALLQRLVNVCSRALFADFAGFRACQQQPGLAAVFGKAPAGGMFQQFMAQMRDGGWLSFLGQYPVAARLCATAVELWVEMAAEFLGWLADDASVLAATFAGGKTLGHVVGVDVNLSDPHLGGRSVVIVRFAAGVRVVYKPRPIGIERLYADIIEWVNRRGGMHPLRRLAIVLRPTHGWIEYAEQGDCDGPAAVERYFERCGMLLCLAHVLGGTDFHFENLIAAGEDPILIDMEGLVAHRFPLADEMAVSTMPAGETSRLALRSVLNTRLLPHWKIAGETHASDMGGLSRTAEPVEVEVATWADVNGDDMRLGRRRFTHHAKQHNLPRLGGEPVAALAHVDRIVEGYRHTYRLVQKGRDEWLDAGGLLDGARTHRVRFIFRDTSLYATLLERCLHPRYLRSGIDRGIELDVLSRTLLRSAERPAVWPLLQAEREALERLD
ncbi:MAG TPA: type 2 lanthipeptide synthetase LanM, partial [Longimicrobium sp.]|nr:type 2 lanthipeptide synthetase LanM [Longimicrobium sp.]